MSADLIDLARSGDEAAFEELVGPHRREMQIHCYRVLGSLTDAEDALQETMAAAWRGLAAFEGRSSIRTWLYRIATGRCLNMLRSASRRPAESLYGLGIEAPEPTRLGEVIWLEPYPDALLGNMETAAGNPEARYATREAMSLAFVTALQLLPPRQRATLILRDVLDFSGREVADLLDMTEQSVASALKRARATLARQMPSPERPPPAAGSPAEEAVLAGLVRAFEDGDVDALVALLSDDVWVRMPPVAFEYQGRELARRFFSSVAFRDNRRYRFAPTRANGQPAFGVYLRDPLTKIAYANALFVITLQGAQVTDITRFDDAFFHRFGLARTLAD